LLRTGIPGELYYVKDGVINDYALTFNLPLKPDVDEIYFNWQNLRHIMPVIVTMSIIIIVIGEPPQGLDALAM